MIVGAKTTAKFLGDIYTSVSNRDNWNKFKMVAYQVLRLTLCNASKMEHKELKTVAMSLRHGSKRFAQVRTSFCLIHDC
jgi:hypothetical protein